MDLGRAGGAPVVTPYYQDAAVTLYHGSCIDILPQIEIVDHVITDPPYARDVYIRALGNNTKKGSKTPDRLYKGASMAKLAAGDIGAIDEMIEPVSVECSRLVRRWVVVFSDAETTWRWRKALEASGLRYIRTGAWVKPDPMPQMTGDRPCVGFEPCTIAHAQGPMRWNGGGKAAVWTYYIAKGNARPNHPCPKPEPLMLKLVQQFTDPDELVLDPFAGSGTTLRAAKRLGRRAIGIEVDEKFAEEAAKWCERSQLGIQDALFEAERQPA